MLNAGKSRFPSGKTKILILVICNLIICNLQYSQNITNTLGTSGTFTIKDGTTSYLTLSQSTGQINVLKTLQLENTTSSSVGVLYKGVNRFLHNYGTGCTFLGVNSGNFTMTGVFNTGVGTGSLYSNTTGLYNTGVGTGSLYSNTTGENNTAVGMESLSLNTTGYNNTALGIKSLSTNSTGLNNTATGSFSLSFNTTGSFNVAFGSLALYLNTTSERNSAFGYQSLTNNTGERNSAFGYQSLSSNTTGVWNSAFGYQSLNLNTMGVVNSAFGYSSLFSNTTGSNNSAFGYLSLSSNTTGTNNTGIGYNAQVPSGIANNQVRIGNTSVTYAGVQVAWTITSDRRWKSNISNSNLGLSFINKLRPVTYTRNNDESGKTEYGVIAQEVEEVLKSEGVENTGMLTVTDEGMYELRYNDLIAPMIKAIQELKAENDALKDKLTQFEEMQSVLAGEIEKLKDNNIKAVNSQINSPENQ